MKTVWITRARPGAESTATRVRDLGHDAVVAPLLAVRALRGVTCDLTGVAALAFTSANGVRAFAALSPMRALPVFTVGAGTAAAARAIGFVAVESADGDVAALSGMLVARRPSGVILHPGALEPAGDLVGALRLAGLRARDLPLYDTVPQDLAEAVLAGLATFDAVLLQSPKAGRCFNEVLRGTPTPNLDILCLSPQVRQTLSGVCARRVATAAFPNEDALLSLLKA